MVKWNFIKNEGFIFKFYKFKTWLKQFYKINPL